MTISIFLVPNASRSEVIGWHDGALKVRVSAPPIEGRANEALRKLLAEFFAVTPSEVIIEKGAFGRRKRVQLPLEKEEIDQCLLEKKSET